MSASCSAPTRARAGRPLPIDADLVFCLCGTSSQHSLAWRKERRTGKTKEGKEKLNLGGWWVRGNSNLKRQAKQIAEKRKNVLSTVDRFRWRCVQSVPNSTKRSAPTRANDFSSLHEGPRRSDAKSLKQKRQPSDERKHVEERRQGRPLAQWQ